MTDRSTSSGYLDPHAICSFQGFCDNLHIPQKDRRFIRQELECDNSGRVVVAGTNLIFPAEAGVDALIAAAPAIETYNSQQAEKTRQRRTR